MDKDVKKLKRQNRKKMTRRNSTKNQRRVKEVADTVERVGESKDNPFEFYDKYPEYVKYAGTIPYGIPLGSPVDLNRPGTVGGLKADAYSFVIPGIMSIRYVMTPGVSTSKNSPINRAAVAWYTKLRQQQKASGSYDSQDLMIGMLACDSIYTYHDFMVRILGVANLYSVTNKYVPEGLLRAMGVDPVNIRSNIAQLWGYINKYAIDAQRYTIPSNFMLRRRHQWMTSGLYTDAPSRKAQTYMFLPDGYYYYDNTVRTGSQLSYYQWNFGGTEVSDTAKLATVNDLIQFGDFLLSGIVGDEDIGQICGDTLNAYGAENVFRVPMVAADYVVEASYSEEVLMQIENMRCGQRPVLESLVITQDPSVNSGAILFRPSVSYAYEIQAVVTQHNLLLNMHKDDPTYQDNVEATRLTLMLDSVNVSSKTAQVTSCGSEIPVNLLIWVNNNVDKPSQFNWYPIEQDNAFAWRNKSGAGASFQDWVYNCWQHSLLASFKWHPLCYWMAQNADGAVDNPAILYLQNVIGDLDNIAVLTYQQLSVMHDAALVSLVDVQL